MPPASVCSKHNVGEVRLLLLVERCDVGEVGGVDALVLEDDLVEDVLLGREVGFVGVEERAGGAVVRLRDGRRRTTRGYGAAA